MPYTARDKKIYNRGFYSGAKYMVMRIIAYFNGYDKVMCFKCGSTLKSKLEIHDKERPNKSGDKNNRNFDDWINIDNLELLCVNPCHSETDGYRGRKY